MAVAEFLFFTFHLFDLLFFRAANQVNISLIVNDNEAEQCVKALHSAFFSSDSSDLDEKCGSQNGSVSISAN